VLCQRFKRDLTLLSPDFAAELGFGRLPKVSEPSISARANSACSGWSGASRRHSSSPRRLRILVEDAQIRLVGEDPVAFQAGDSADEAQPGQLLERLGQAGNEGANRSASGSTAARPSRRPKAKVACSCSRVRVRRQGTRTKARYGSPGEGTGTSWPVGACHENSTGFATPDAIQRWRQIV